MKSGLSLSQLAAEIERQSEAKRDFVAQPSHLSVVVNDDNTPTLAVGDSIQQPMNEHAHGQFAEFLGVPKPYYDRMRAEKPALLAANAAAWLADMGPKQSRLVRSLDGNVRAVLSNSYRPLENMDLAEAVLPALLKMDLLVLSSQITERRIYIKAVHKRIERDVPSGRRMGDGTHVFFDTMVPGIVISNSEVGSGRLMIEQSIYTRACTNLALVGTSFAKHHLGTRADVSESVYALLTDETKALTDASVWAQVRDVVSAAFDERVFRDMTDRVAETSTQKIEGDPVKVVEVTAKQFGLSKTEGTSVLKHLIRGGDLTRYGLFNAVTRTAEDLADYDRATEFERLGGRIVELPKHDWERIAMAA